MGEDFYSHARQELGKRNTSRLRVRLVARVMTTHETGAAELRDLSYFGARFSASQPPQPGADVVVQWGKFEAFGMIVWSGPNGFGVRFYDPIGPEVLIATRDLDDIDHICTNSDLNRKVAKAFVAGQIRG